VCGQTTVTATTTTLTTTSATTTTQMNLVGVAASVSTLSTLVTAVKAAGLVDTLSSAGPFTVFAPDNAAFAKVQGLDAILKDTAQLKAILLLHVVMAKVMSTDLSDGQVSGDLTFTNEGGSWYVASPGSKAKIIQANVGASNGVAHVIDTVLLPAPPTTTTTTTTTYTGTTTTTTLKTIAGVAISTPALSTLVTAVTKADLVDTRLTRSLTSTTSSRTRTC